MCDWLKHDSKPKSLWKNRERFQGIEFEIIETARSWVTYPMKRCTQEYPVDPDKVTLPFSGGRVTNGIANARSCMIFGAYFGLTTKVYSTLPPC